RIATPCRTQSPKSHFACGSIRPTAARSALRKLPDQLIQPISLALFGLFGPLAFLHLLLLVALALGSGGETLLERLRGVAAVLFGDLAVHIAVEVETLGSLLDSLQIARRADVH